jgi:hypothetical protein
MRRVQRVIGEISLPMLLAMTIRVSNLMIYKHFYVDEHIGTIAQTHSRGLLPYIKLWK